MSEKKLQVSAQVAIGLIQAHYEKDDKKFDDYTRKIEHFMRTKGRESVADYIYCVRKGTGFVSMEVKNE